MTWQTATTWQTRECMRFAGKTVNRLPQVMRTEIAKTYLANYKENYKAANLSLAKLNTLIDSMRLDNQPLRDHFDEDKLKEIAEQKVYLFLSMTRNYSTEKKAKYLRSHLEHIGIKADPKLTDKELIVRCGDWQTWRRWLRKTSGRSAEHLALQYGLVCKQKAIYCSDFAVARYRAMKARNRKLMEETLLENEQGQVYSLQQLADSTTANPVIRRKELMTRIRGFEEYAKFTRKAAVFLTVTAPSKYHSRSHKYNKATPRDTQSYLNRVWARIRAKLARERIEIFGFRVGEPHHDGTPHSHYLLFAEADKQKRIVSIFNHYALQEDGNERGAKKARLDVKFIDRRKGSAVSYIAKYISKNIDGHGVDSDLYGFNAASSAERISAWASVWGIRQFQQIGGLPVTVWRTLRAIETEFDNPHAERARLAADSGEWDMFLRYGKGLQLFKQSHWEVINHETGELKTYATPLNRYDELCDEKIIGIYANCGEIRLKNMHFWEPRERPWTRVNNCTELNKNLNIVGREPPDNFH